MTIEAHLGPPIKLGHDERQRLVQDSGFPAAGRWTNLWTEDAKDPQGRPVTKLLAMGSNVIQPLRKPVNNGAYFQVSAEVYDNPPDDLKEKLTALGGKGKVFRAAALLGEDVPRVKSLKDLPKLWEETGDFERPVEIFRSGVANDVGEVYTDADLKDMARNFHLLKASGIDPSKYSEASGRIHRVFFEPRAGTTMNPEQMRQKMSEAGFPEATVKGMDDQQVKAFYDSCTKMAGGTKNDDGESEEDKKKKADAEAAAKAANEKEGKTENDDGKVDTQSKEVKAMYAELKKAAEKFEREKATFFTEARDLLKGSKAEADAAARRLGELADNATRQARRTVFSEKVKTLVAKGVAPAINDGNLIEFIAETLPDDTKAARKFSEDKTGVKNLTPFEAFQVLIDRIPATVKTVEKGAVLRGGGSSDFSEAELNGEVDTVRKTYQAYAETFLKQGTTEEDLVNAYKKVVASAKKDGQKPPTAEEHIGFAA